MNKLCHISFLLIFCFQGHAQNEDKYFNRMNPLIRGYEGDSKMEEEFFKRGNLKMTDQAYEQAIDDFTQAVKLNSKFTDAYINRGLLRIKTGMKEDGCKDIHKAAELGDVLDGEALKELRK
jgi:hypothetical protein